MSFGPILRFLFWAPLCCTLSARAGALTWDDAIKCADQNNSEIQAARASAEAAKFSAQAAQGTYFPAIAGSLGYTRSNSSSASPSTEASNAYSATLSASQNIFNGLQDQAHVAQARASLQSAEAALNIAKAKASYDLKSAYSNLQFALKSIKLQQDILKRREDNARMVELRFEGGRENRGSVLLSVAYLNQAKLEALQAKNNLTEARRQLLRVLGTEAEIASDAQITSQTPEENPAIEDLARNTPEYLQSTAQETSAKAAVAVARGGFFPTLGANLSLGKQGPDWFPENSRWSAGLNLSVPLFNGGHDYYGLRAASASLESSSCVARMCLNWPNSLGGAGLFRKFRVHRSWLALIFVECRDTSSPPARHCR